MAGNSNNGRVPGMAGSRKFQEVPRKGRGSCNGKGGGGGSQQWQAVPAIAVVFRHVARPKKWHGGPKK